jgi:thiol-disulfide isomerase/thioredoxin
MFKNYFLIILFIINSVNSLAKTSIKPGQYRGVLVLNEKENIELPFNFDLTKTKSKIKIVIKNGQEKIVVDEVKLKGDSLNFKMPVFDTEFKCKISGDTIKGFWINNYRTSAKKIPFFAYPSNQRFLVNMQPAKSIFEGRWETTFSPNSNDSSKAIGVFKHIEQTNFIEGTFLTETGDYRYLDGVNVDNQLFLSCFDGSHAFLFTGVLTNTKITGKFYSGSHYQTNWIALENKNFKLKNANEITFLNNKNSVINFSFKDLNEKIVSINDEKYKDKPVLLQVMGSWCPNCMDESAYLAEVYKKYNLQGLEIIALAFEKTTDFKKAQQQVTRLKNRFNIEYNILITQLSGKDKASETLNALNKISSFPTLLFLNKQHQVVKIHTGFNGPATGIEFENFKQETEALINELLK